MIDRVRSYRGSYSRLAAALKGVSDDGEIQINTLWNYTRFPLAVLEWAGWTEKVRDKSIYGRSMVFHRLTDFGRRQVEGLKSLVDIRGDMIVDAPSAVRESACKLGAVAMLERAGFDPTPVMEERIDWVRELVAAGVLDSEEDEILFSPFQELDPSTTSSALTEHLTRQSVQVRDHSDRTYGRRRTDVTTMRITGSPHAATEMSTGPMRLLLRDAVESGKSLEDAADAVVASLDGSNRDAFYPAVAELFQCLGYVCEVSRAGVNYQRWDAFIVHPTDSVPIEIKSPGEERFISVKGVRQALENKVILLARGGAPTRRETTSLLVGYLAPNDRAEVADLVADIHSAFGVSVGVIDFGSLALLAAAAAAGLEHDRERLLTLRGFMHVAAP